jgi:hypothetical protein
MFLDTIIIISRNPSAVSGVARAQRSLLESKFLGIVIENISSYILVFSCKLVPRINIAIPYRNMNFTFYCFKKLFDMFMNSCIRVRRSKSVYGTTHIKIQRKNPML